jgi:MarR family transcriptional repressor of emrRAB
LAPYQLSNIGYFAMMMLYSTPDNLANPSEICKVTGETRGNMTRICDDLVEKDLMRRVTSPDDRRRVNLSLTDKGISLLQTIVPEIRAGVKGLFSSFSETEKANLVKLLLKLNAALESHS